ncbi:hypothetical protein [Nonomuraea sp. NPDC049400]|uniref:hypothetical protein n=1 Tax=Nonomuraea sp. NPDC049400 TaxID=3364352 RepID=UPI003793DE21
MTSTNSFLGIPVVGDINEGEKRAKQRPIEELAPLLQAVVNDPYVAEFGWTQYTPYFNDGDPCTFGVRGEVWFRTVEDADVDDTYELELNNHPTLGIRRWNRDARRYDEIRLSPEKREVYDRCDALNTALEGGEFLDVLLEAFGDHAEITVKKDAIQVEFYQHD